MSSFPLRFTGRVKTRRDPAGPLRLTLSGTTRPSRNETLQISFATVSPPDIPPELQEVEVNQLSDRRYRIASAGHEWMVDGVAHLHRSAGAEFNEALPPRQVPWRKRLLWRALLTSAALISRMRGSPALPASRVEGLPPDSNKH